MRRLLFLLLVSIAGAACAQPGEMRVLLLGTGTPFPSATRAGPGVLVQAGGQTLLFDNGRGITQRLLQAKIRLGEADKLFLTHLHSDHVVGIPDLWLTGWLEAAYAQRKGPFRVWGPRGTRNMVEHLQRAYEWDIDTRIRDQKLNPDASRITSTEIGEGVVYDQGGLKVTAFEVDHGELIKPALGFRVDYAGRSVVISGDTRPSENLVRHAIGVDVLIHQVAAVREPLLADPVYEVILAHHTNPVEAGTVFSRARPKMAVFYHFVLLGTPKVPPVTENEVLEMTRKTYDGPLTLGEDLMSFRLTQEGVQVGRAP